MSDNVTAGAAVGTGATFASDDIGGVQLESNRLVYVFTSPSGKSYVGQTSNFDARVGQHMNTNKCPAFRSAINKYGIESFDIIQIAKNLTISQANFMESWCIRCFGSLFPGGYNLQTGGQHSLPSEETRRKISESKKKSGYKHSAETIQKIVSKNKGRIQSPEERAKRREGSLKAGCKPPILTSQQIRGWNLGRKQSKETREKRRISMLGKNTNRVQSEDERNKRRIARLAYLSRQNKESSYGR